MEMNYKEKRGSSRLLQSVIVIDVAVLNDKKEEHEILETSEKSVCMYVCTAIKYNIYNFIPVLIF